MEDLRLTVFNGKSKIIEEGGNNAVTTEKSIV